MASVDRRLVHNAALALLQAEMPAEVPIGDGRAPAPVDGEQRRLGPDLVTGRRRGYLILHRVSAGAAFEGQSYVGQPDSIVTVRFQVVGYGTQRDQADLVSGIAHGILVDRVPDAWPPVFVHPVAVAGHAILDRESGGEIPVEAGQGLEAAGFLVNWRVQRTG